MSGNSVKVLSEPLTKPPRPIEHIFSRGNLLAAWNWFGLIDDKDGSTYHFAIHSPAWGWRKYYLGKIYQNVSEIAFATQDAVWVRTGENDLICLLIGKSGDATITANMVGYKLFDANESGCLVQATHETIKHLHFDKDKTHLTTITFYTGMQPVWARFLSDGAIAALTLDRLLVFSPEGAMVHEQKVQRSDRCTPFYCTPFIIRINRNNRIYYTDDPRKKWNMSDALRVIQERRIGNVGMCFFTVLDDECYIGVDDNNGNIHLYRSSVQSPERVEHLWRISDGIFITYGIFMHCIERYNRLICVSTSAGFFASDDIAIPKNNGFLVWDPTMNAFYADIPRTTNIQKMSAGRVPPISIPDVWGRNTEQR